MREASTTGRTASCLAVLLLVAGCAGLPPPPVGMPPAPAGPAGIAPEPRSAFTVEPGDLLAITLTSVQSTFMDRLPVDGAGTLHVPGVGDIAVGGRTLADAQRQIELALEREDRLGSVSIKVAAPDGHRVTVLGTVAQPGSVSILPGMTLSAVYAAAGGGSGPGVAPSGAPADGADLEAALLVRDGHPLPVSLAQALAGDPRHDISVHPRDLLVVPARTATVSVLGQVGGPTAFRHYRGLRMTEALATAGGVTVDGDKSDIRLIRGEPADLVVYQADLTAIVDGSRPDVALVPGDVIFVTDDPLEDAYEVFAVVGPALGMVITVAVLSLTLGGD